MDNTPTEKWTEIKDEKGNVIAQKSSVTGKVVADPRYRESKLLTDEELAQQQKLKAAGKTDITNTVNQGGEAVQIDKIPKDHMLIKDGDNYRMEVIEGSPTDIERKELAKKKEGAEESQIDTANLVQEELGRAKDKIMKNPKLTTGFFGEQLKNWGGSDAADVKALLDTIGANIGFDYLNSMRQNSPTGGALGQVSERELALLTATAGSLAQAQSAEQLVQNLERLEKQMLEVIHGKEAAANMLKEKQKQNEKDQDINSMPLDDLVNTVLEK